MHDRNGNPVAVGDKVMVPATIISCSTPIPLNKYCNITVQFDVKMGLDDPNAYFMTTTLNAGQVEKVL